jgi:hypothetical protein
MCAFSSTTDETFGDTQVHTYLNVIILHADGSSRMRRQWEGRGGFSREQYTVTSATFAPLTHKILVQSFVLPDKPHTIARLIARPGLKDEKASRP